MTHYYSEEQDSKYEPFLIPISSRGNNFNIYSASGVFSLKHLDKGTEVMLKFADLTNAKKIADLGCGYGVVGITLLLENPELEVSFFDINKRAIMLTKKNLDLLHLNGYVKKNNIFENISESFDLILTNPPYSAGRDVCIEFIEQAFTHLVDGGSLQLVCRRRKGGDFLEKTMGNLFGNVEVIGQKSGFRLYKSVKQNDLT